VGCGFESRHSAGCVSTKWKVYSPQRPKSRVQTVPQSVLERGRQLQRRFIPALEFFLLLAFARVCEDSWSRLNGSEGSELPATTRLSGLMV
jgi:hypothetical protein